MRRRLRFGIPLVAVVAATVASFLLLTRPWQGEEAAAETITYRLCNVSLQAPPPPSLREFAEKSTLSSPVLISGLVSGYAPSSATIRVELYEPRQGNLVIDALTGDVISKSYSTPSDQAFLEGILATVQVQPLDSSTAPWPYTDATQVPGERLKDGNIEYRLPDPGAGLVMETFFHNPVVAPLPEDLSFVIFRNCRSELWIGRQTGTVMQERTSIHPQDAGAFQRFIGEVKLGK